MLLELFEKREDHWQSDTVTILEKMTHVLEGAFQHLEETGGISPHGTLVWDDVSLLGELVLIIGNVVYEPGTKIYTETGEEITVTEENAHHFDNFIRVGVPLELAQNGSVEDVKAFLVDISGENELDEMEGNQQNVHSINDHTDFNLSQLTEEQLEQLEMFSKTKENKNESDS